MIRIRPCQSVFVHVIYLVALTTVLSFFDRYARLLQTEADSATSAGFELIPDFSQGVDEHRVVGIGLDLASQRRDEPVHAAVPGEGAVSPDGVEDFIAGERLALPSDKQFQQLVLLGR